MRRLPLTVAPLARLDLAAIRKWLLVEAGPRAAHKMVAAIGTRISGLREWPLAGVAQPDLGERVRFVPVSPYVIYYELTDGRLHVLRILHGARDRGALMATAKQDDG